MKTKKIKHKKRVKRSHRRHRKMKGGNTTTRPIKLFNLDLHTSVIEDITSILKVLFNNNVDVTNWNLSDNTNFNKSMKDVKHINASTWKSIDMDMIKRFQDEYDGILKEYDGFIVTHTPVFAMLYEKYNKPIIVINSCRYDQPFCWNKNQEMLKLFDDSLKRMRESNQLTIVSNNRGDKEYLKAKTGIDSIYIPSLCMYTNASFNPIHKEFVVFENKIKDRLKQLPNSSLVVGRPAKYEFKELAEYSGIIHMPYDVSSMALFEQYFAELPLFFPTKEFYKECVLNRTINFIVKYDDHHNPDIVLPPEEIDKWLENADYYNFKYINYYSSFEDCIHKINSYIDKDKDERIKYINDIKKDSVNKWRDIFNKNFKLNSTVEYIPK